MIVKRCLVFGDMVPKRCQMKVKATGIRCTRDGNWTVDGIYLCKMHGLSVAREEFEKWPAFSKGIIP